MDITASEREDGSNDSSTGAMDRKALYDKHLSQAWEDQQKSSDDFDKNLLTYSSGALAVSLAFIKDVVPLDKATSLHWLLASWVSFATCIAVTIASLQFAVQAQKVHAGFLYKYYIERNEKYFNKQSWWSIAVTACAIVGSAAFLSGLLATIVFAWENLGRSPH